MDNQTKQGTKINTMLGDKFYRIQDAQCTLVRLFRNVLFERQIGISDWNSLMDRYSKKSKHKVRRGHSDSSNDKSNLTKALSNNKMSMSTFHRAMCFLDIRSYKITIGITWKNGSTTEHSQNVIVSDKVNKFSFIKEEDDDAK